jgi:phage tail-like protein
MKNWHSWRIPLLCAGTLALALLISQLGRGAQRTVVPPLRGVPAATGVAGGVTYQLAVAGRLTTTFSSCSGIATDQDVVEYVDGEDKTMHKRPGRNRIANVVLSRNATSDMQLWAWRQDVIDGKMTNARKTCTITALDSAGKPMMVWELSQGWPCALTTGVKDGANQLVEELTITVETVTRKQ